MSFRRSALLIAAAPAMLLGACNALGERTSVRDRSEIVAAPESCQDVTFPIYFETGSTELTQPALQSIRTHAADARQCSVREVLVVGLADAGGSASRNLQLSRQRAQSVAAALAAQGFPAPSFDIEAAGAAGAVAPTGQPEPLRRRAEVVVRLGPPASGASAAPAS